VLHVATNNSTIAALWIINASGRIYYAKDTCLSKDYRYQCTEFTKWCLLRNSSKHNRRKIICNDDKKINQRFIETAANLYTHYIILKEQNENH